MSLNVLQRAKKVLQIERDALNRLAATMAKPKSAKKVHPFEEAVALLESCSGRVVISGMGKPGLIGKKIAATFSSMGIPSLSLHPAEAVHGDLGMVTSQDVVLAMSHSGETDEIVRVLPILKRIGPKLIAMTANTKSKLAVQADVILDTCVKEEANPWGVVPTASTTAMLALGDALAVVIAERRGFSPEDFASLHPGGALGKRLTLYVEDLMRKGKEHPVVKQTEIVKQVLLKITEARAGSACVVDAKGKLVGIFTDGDLRRHAEDKDVLQQPVKTLMTRKPKTLDKKQKAIDALKLMEQYRIDELPVVDKQSKPIGLLDIQDLLKAGLV